MFLVFLQYHWLQPVVHEQVMHWVPPDPELVSYREFCNQQFPLSVSVVCATSLPLILLNFPIGLFEQLCILGILHAQTYLFLSYVLVSYGCHKNVIVILPDCWELLEDHLLNLSSYNIFDRFGLHLIVLDYISFFALHGISSLNPALFKSFCLQVVKAYAINKLWLSGFLMDILGALLMLRALSLAPVSQTCCIYYLFYFIFVFVMNCVDALLLQFYMFIDIFNALPFDPLYIYTLITCSQTLF